MAKKRITSRFVTESQDYFFRKRDASRVDLAELGQGRIVIFRDPSQPGFPYNKSEIGIVWNVFKGNQGEPLVLVVMPISTLDKSICKPAGVTLISSNYDREKVNMGLNSHYNFRIGHKINYKGDAPAIDSMRFLPTVDGVLEITEDNEVTVLGQCDPELLAHIEDQLNRQFAQHPEARKQIIAEVQLLNRYRHNLDMLTERRERPDMGKIEVTHRNRQVG